MTARRPASIGSSRLPSGLFLVGSGLLILHPLAAFWTRNDAYFFGWGVPFLATYLLVESWMCRPEPMPKTVGRASPFLLAAILFLWGVLLFATRLITETEPNSRPVLWMNASLWIGAVLAWFWLEGGRPWLRHFVFPVAFLFLSVPWVFRFEFALVQGLMRVNAAWVTDSLLLLDVPARAAGNTILLTNGQLGVNEACSGIRSLQATLMMSLFFGEFYRFPLRTRWLLPMLGAVLALIGNYARLLFLAWHGARDGMASVEAVHDSAGFLILAFTVISLWLVCLTLRTSRSAPSHRRASFNDAPFTNRLTSRLAFRWAAGVLVAALFSESATQVWYAWRESSAARFPSWTVAWPRDAPDFHRVSIPLDVHDQLHNDGESAAAWRDGAGWIWSGAWFHYHADAAGKIVFASHNPELCLPAAGWRETEDDGAFLVQVQQVRLQVRGYRFDSPSTTHYVFWIPYLDRGAIPDDEKTSGLYGHSLAAIAQLRFPFLADVWNGCRGADAETLEMTLAGPASYADAERAFRRVLAQLVLPDAHAAVAGR